jgi:signal transduction histidine kinase
VPNTRSELALPLVMGRTVLGVLDIQSDQVAAFRLDDLPVFQSLADQVATAIQNASLYQSEKTRRQLAETLYEVSRAFSRTLDLPEVLDLILEHLAKTVPYHRAAVMLQNKGELEVVAARGFPEGVQPLQLRISIKEDDVFQQIYQTQQPLVIPDVLQRPDWQHQEYLPQTRAWLGVPLTRFDHVIGMVSLTRAIPNAFNSDEVKLATTFAGQAAFALENARLYDKIVRFSQQLEEMVRERTVAVQEAYDQLERLDRTKSDFISIAAHELRTPLTVLRGYSKMLLNDALIKENSHRLELVTGIHTGAVRLQEIVTSMLDIAKIDGRVLELYPEPLAIPSFIELVAQTFTEPLAERKQTLTIADMSDLPPIMADPDAMQKVFYHLIINAIKYTPDGGKITITGRCITGGWEEPFPGIEIIVSDTGIGIDPQLHELIFTKFYQTGELALHSTGKTVFKGAGPGLGLTVARGIVEAHRGKIWVESPGHDEKTFPGSQFHIVLPLRQRN